MPIFVRGLENGEFGDWRAIERNLENWRLEIGKKYRTMNGEWKHFYGRPAFKFTIFYHYCPVVSVASERS